MKVIAAMSRNRVIGNAGKTPWHVPEDLQWFKRATLGQAVLMGRRTFESIGSRALPGRLNLVASRGELIDVPGVVTVRDLAAFQPDDYAPREMWIMGGGEIYSQMLPRCSEVYLSVIDCDVKGDTFLPAFEDEFSFLGVVLKNAGIEVRHYRRDSDATEPSRR
jgi:dihydrofolate reductase